MFKNIEYRLIANSIKKIHLSRYLSTESNIYQYNPLEIINSTQ